MMDARLYKLVTAAVVGAAIVACSEAPTQNDPMAPGALRLGIFNPGTGDAAQTANAERLEVCKRYQMTSGASVPASTTFDFSSVADPGNNQSFSITSGANNVYACREIWQDGSTGGDVTVTEPAILGFTTRVTRVEDVLGVETTPVNDVVSNTLTGRVGGTSGGFTSTGQLFLFTNVENVEEQDGCTYTQGYWKTHSSYGPAGPADDGWLDAEIGGPDATFFYSGESWIDLFNTSPKGNAYIILAHQYMAAALNIENGAGPAPAEFALATTFFNNAANTLTTNYSKTTQGTLKTWAGALAGFNEGLTGPGHCEDEVLPPV